MLPLSKRLALFFAGVNAASRLAGFLIMGWIYVAGEETVINPVLAPLVSAIVLFSLDLFQKCIHGKTERDLRSRLDQA